MGLKTVLPSNGIEKCNCAVPSPDDAKVLGLDPITPSALYLVLSRVTSSSVLNNVHVGTRDREPKYIDSSGLLYKCKYNQTYTAQECCGSRDGIIWLP